MASKSGGKLFDFPPMRTTNSFKKKITPNKKPGKAKAQNHNEIPDKKRGEKTKIPIKAERPSTSSGSSNPLKKPLVRKTPLCQQYLNS